MTQNKTAVTSQTSRSQISTTNEVYVKVAWNNEFYLSPLEVDTSNYQVAAEIAVQMSKVAEVTVYVYQDQTCLDEIAISIETTVDWVCEYIGDTAADYADLSYESDLTFAAALICRFQYVCGSLPLPW